MQQHITMPPPSVRTVLPDAPDALDAAIQRATAKQPGDRFDSAMALIAALQRAAAEAPTLRIGAERARAEIVHPSTSSHTNTPTALPGMVPPPPGVATVVLAAADRSAVAIAHPALPTVTIAAAGPLHQDPPSPDDATAMLQAMMPPGIAVPKHADLTVVPPSALASVPGAPLVIPPHLLGLPRPRKRPTSFTAVHWIVIGAAAAILLFLIAANLWLTRSRTATVGVVAAAYDHHVAIRKALAVVALLLAILNVTLMRVAIVEDFHVTREAYRRLRQNHRFVGYLSAAIAITVQALAWIGIAGSSSFTGAMLAFIALGAVLLVLAVVKVATVRFIPAWRHHLPNIGWALLIFYTLVLVANLVLAIP
jgi:hypothetical protein